MHVKLVAHAEMNFAAFTVSLEVQLQNTVPRFTLKQADHQIVQLFN